MKQKVIEFFQNLPKEKYEQFNDAFELYRKSEGKSLGMEKGINASGFSEHALGNLLYDLQKLHGITDVEKVQVVKSEKLVVSGKEIEGAKWDYLDPEVANLFQTLLALYPEDIEGWAAKTQISISDIEILVELSVNAGIVEVSDKLKLVVDYLNTPIGEDVLANTEVPAVSTEAIHTNPEDVIDNFLADGMNKAFSDLKTLTGSKGSFGIDFGMLKQENEDLQDEKADLEEELEATTEENENLKDELDKLKSLPKIDAKSIRVEFPFLNEKDCPDEFKILVADKITAWNDYLQCHETLRSIESGELVTDDASKAEIAKAGIASFYENQKIYDELVAYAETGKVLGVHPIFKKLQMTREVEEMTADELHNYKGSSAKYFSVNKTALAKAEKAKDTDKIELITNRVAERELRLALVNKKLGIKAK